MLKLRPFRDYQNVVDDHGDADEGLWKEEVGHRRTKGDGREGLGNATVTN